MRVTVSPTGEISIESNGSKPADVAEMVRELRKQEPKDEPAPAEPTRPVSLNDIQGAVYDWLVANDNPHGVHVGAVARQFNLTNGAAGSRLERLLKMGFVQRVGAGRYRAVTE